ncbi:MAG TPA: Tm-1-like ATP-binding domain-containing protein, partial [Pirellulales bacterium]
KFHQHNASVTLMRTTVEENRAIGQEIGRKVATARGPVAVFLPRRGVSAIDRAGQPFDDPAARCALFEGLRRAAGAAEIHEFECHINDPEFAKAAAERLIEMMKQAARK